MLITSLWIFPAIGTASFQDNDNGTVTDTETGLMWQQETGMSMDWITAIQYCEDLNLAGYSDWRLPDINELRSIVDRTVIYPSIDKNYFHNTINGFYWSSTTYADNINYAMYVNFANGGFNDYGKWNLWFVRAVRSGNLAPDPFDPLAISIQASPSSGHTPLPVSLSVIIESGTAPYTFSWDFGDGNGGSSEQNPTYTYTQPGTYIATITVTDGVGNSISKSVPINSMSSIITDGLVAYYPLNGNADDESGNGNHGVVNGATLTEDRFGNADSAYYFDGNGDHITVSENDLIPYGNDSRTVALWIYTTENSWGTDTHTIFSYGTGAVGAYAMDMMPYPGIQFYTWANGDIDGTTSNPKTGWIHLAFTFGDNNLSAFINGVKISAEHTATLTTTMTDILIGCEDDYLTCTKSSYLGKIDDVRIYNRVLSEAEVAQLYEEKNDSAGITLSVLHLYNSSNESDMSIGVYIDTTKTSISNNDITDISIYNPDGSILCTKSDMSYWDYSNDFEYDYSVSDTQPDIGTYTVTVTTANQTLTASKNYSETLYLPIPDYISFSPIEDATISSTTPTFSWDAVNYSNSNLYYRMRIYTYPEGENIFKSSYTPNMLSYTLESGILEVGKSYKWCVEVYDGSSWENSNNRARSEKIKFTVSDSEEDNCIEVPLTQTMIDASSIFVTAPVMINERTISINSPSYCDPIDFYIAIINSDGELLFIDSTGDLTFDLDPYAAGITSEINISFSVENSFLVSKITGECALYWLITPANGGDILQSLNGPYELGYYVFIDDSKEVNCDEILPTITSITPNTIQPATLLTVKGANFECLDIENHALVIDAEPSNILNIDRDNNTFQIAVPMLETGTYDLYIDFTQGQKSNVIAIDIAPLSLPIDMNSDEILDSTISTYTELIENDLSEINNNEELSDEEKEGFSSNIEIMKSLLAIFENYIHNEMTENEKYELAAILNNTGLLKPLTNETKKINKKRRSTDSINPCGDTYEHNNIVNNQFSIEAYKSISKYFKFGCWTPVVSIPALILQLQSIVKEASPVIITALRVHFLEGNKELYKGDAAPVCLEGDFESIHSEKQTRIKFYDWIINLLLVEMPCLSEYKDWLWKIRGLDLDQPLFLGNPNSVKKNVKLDPTKLYHSTKFISPEDKAPLIVNVNEKIIGVYDDERRSNMGLQYVDIEGSIADKLEMGELDVSYKIKVGHHKFLSQKIVFSDRLIFKVKNRKPKALDIQKQWSDSGLTEIKIPSIKYDEETDTFEKVYSFPIYDGTKDNDSIQKVEIVDYPIYGKLYDYLDDGVNFITNMDEYIIVTSVINYRLDNLDSVPEGVGHDSFTYRIFDGAEWSEPAKVTIAIHNCIWYFEDNSYNRECGCLEWTDDKDSCWREKLIFYLDGGLYYSHGVTEHRWHYDGPNELHSNKTPWCVWNEDGSLRNDHNELGCIAYPGDCHTWWDHEDPETGEWITCDY